MLSTLLASLFSTGLCWIGERWREGVLGLELSIAGVDDDGVSWSRRMRVRGIDEGAVKVAALPSRHDLRLAWSGGWQVPESGRFLIRVRVDGDLRLVVDGIEALTLVGVTSKRLHDVRLPLSRGFHDLHMEWFSDRPGARVRVGWAMENGLMHGFEEQLLLPSRPSAARLALIRMVGLSRPVTVGLWGLALALLLVWAAQRDLLGHAADARATVAPRGAMARPVPWPVAVAAGTVAVLLPGLLLLFHAAVWRADLDLGALHSTNRYFEDLAIASSQYLQDRSPRPLEPESIASWPGSWFKVQLKRFVIEQVALQPIRPWQFWKTLDPTESLEMPPPLHHRGIEDVGRSRLARAGFHLVGGIAPFLPLWVAPLCAVPLLGWVVWESLRAGRLTVGVAFGVLFACSPFVVELLTLHFSTAGFYVLGLVAVLALSVFVLLGPPPGALALLVRCGGFGCAFALCTIGRAGVGLFAPVAVVLLLAGAARGLRGWRARAGVSLLGAALLLGPYAVCRPSQHHAVWIGVWQGLGDFDRTKGHAFSDRVVKHRLIDAGVTDVPVHRGLASFDKEDYSRESAFLRDEVLRHVRSDPGWLLKILAKRVVAAVTQAKLMDGGRHEGSSFVPATTPNEGSTDVYYRFTRTADWVGLGPWRRELPVPVLWLPLLGWSLGRLRRPAGSSGPVWALLAVACCALSVPVAISVAGAFETQSFVLVYQLGAALACQDLALGLMRRGAGESR